MLSRMLSTCILSEQEPEMNRVQWAQWGEVNLTTVRTSILLHWLWQMVTPESAHSLLSSPPPHYRAFCPVISLCHAKQGSVMQNRAASPAVHTYYGSKPSVMWCKSILHPPLTTAESYSVCIIIWLMSVSCTRMKLHEVRVLMCFCFAHHLIANTGWVHSGWSISICWRKER